MMGIFRKMILLGAVFIISCSGSGGTLLTQDEIRQAPGYAAQQYNYATPGEFYQKGTEYLEKEMPQHAIDVYGQLVKKYPDYENSLDAWLSIARIYSDVYRDYDKAIEKYKFIVQTYPDETLTFKAFFMLGFIYANYVDDIETAKQYYDEFLERYPDHELAASVKFELENLGKVTDDFFIAIEDDSTSIFEEDQE